MRKIPIRKASQVKSVKRVTWKLGSALTVADIESGIEEGKSAITGIPI